MLKSLVESLVYFTESKHSRKHSELMNFYCSIIKIDRKLDVLQKK